MTFGASGLWWSSTPRSSLPRTHTSTPTPTTQTPTHTMAAICSLAPRIVCAARAPKVRAAAEEPPAPPPLKAGSTYKDLNAAVKAGLVQVRPPNPMNRASSPSLDAYVDSLRSGVSRAIVPPRASAAEQLLFRSTSIKNPPAGKKTKRYSSCAVKKPESSQEQSRFIPPLPPRRSRSS